MCHRCVFIKGLKEKTQKTSKDLILPSFFLLISFHTSASSGVHLGCRLSFRSRALLSAFQARKIITLRHRRCSGKQSVVSLSWGPVLRISFFEAFYKDFFSKLRLTAFEELLFSEIQREPNIAPKSKIWWDPMGCLGPKATDIRWTHPQFTKG